MQAYSNPDREHDPWSLPDLEIFQMTAREVAQMDEDLVREYTRKHEFQNAGLAGMISRDSEKILDAIIEETGITGGWYYHYCFPGCLPDGEPIGPYKSAQEAKQAALEDALQ